MPADGSSVSGSGSDPTPQVYYTDGPDQRGETKRASENVGCRAGRRGGRGVESAACKAMGCTSAVGLPSCLAANWPSSNFVAPSWDDMPLTELLSNNLFSAPSESSLCHLCGYSPFSLPLCTKTSLA